MEIEQKQTAWPRIGTTNTYQITVLSKFWWILYLICSVSMICLFIYFLFMVDLAKFWIPATFMLPVAVALGVLALSSIKNLTMRLTISNSIIHCNDILRSRQIAFHNVKGFRVISTAQRSDIGLPGWEIEIESTNGTIITIPKSITHQGALIAFLQSEFINLDEHALKVYLKLNGDN